MSDTLDHPAEGAFYGADLAAIHAEGFEALARDAAAAIRRRLSPGDTVLDLGCGAGPLCALLAGDGIAARGIDLSPSLIALARARLPRGDFAVGDVATAPLGRADAVCAVGEVLNYATSGDATLPALLARIRAALPEGGTLLMDLAAPGRHADRPRVWTEGPGGHVAMTAEARGSLLTRRIVTFRPAGGAWRRAEEVHRLRLHAPDAVLSALADAGFEASRLPGYAAPLPPGLHAYLGRAR